MGLHQRGHRLLASARSTMMSDSHRNNSVPTMPSSDGVVKVDITFDAAAAAETTSLDGLRTMSHLIDERPMTSPRIYLTVPNQRPAVQMMRPISSWAGPIPMHNNRSGSRMAEPISPRPSATATSIALLRHRHQQEDSRR